MTSHLELLDSGKAAKYYTLASFDVQLNEALIAALASTLTTKSKKAEDS